MTAELEPIDLVPSAPRGLFGLADLLPALEHENAAASDSDPLPVITDGEGSSDCD